MVRTSLHLACAIAVVLTACKGDKKEEAPAAEAKAPAPEDEIPALEVAEGDPPVDGPVPPETSMVLFGIEGALYPLACFDATKKALASGSACLKMVDAGAEVRVASEDAEYNKVAQGHVEPQCLIGSGKEIAVGVEGITEGASFRFGVWPRSTMKLVSLVDRQSVSPRDTQLSEEEQSKLKAAISKAGGTVGEELRAHQVAEIDVDGQGELDKAYSVFVPNPKVSEQYRWSGLFLAPEGDLERLMLVARSKSMRDVFEVEGTADLDGDGDRELWVRMIFEDGAGDRVFTMAEGKVDALGDWTCGAGV